MMKTFTLVLLLALPVFLLAQPQNDDCGGLIDLGVAPACPESVFFTNVGATASNIGFGNIPDCFNGGTVQHDVWFAFTTSDTIFDYTITVTGLTDGTTAGMANPQVALYRGDCSPDNLAELACASAELGATFVELDIMGLTPNITYFIRINDYSATATPNWGTFQLCVDEMEPASTIDEGGSTACSGILYDSGGEDGDYGNNENYVFTICPGQPHECIIFTLDYYFIEPTDLFATDVLTFYDGDAPNPGAIIGQIGGADFTEDGGGGVCYQVQATSGCLTVEFTSDATNTFQGFAGQWECTQDCPDYQPITVTPDISDDQIIDFVSTPTTTATITSINCPQQSYGIFQAGDNSDLGLDRGLLLTSGDLNWAIGPNDDNGGGNPNADNGGLGDADLDYLSQVLGDNTLSENACVVELDVFAATNELTFEYVFGSEEYPEFVNEGYNDIFAFFLSGPGITGDPNIGNQLNIAVLPNGNDTPVQINSVNNVTNWEYYRNNQDGVSIQYDGLTSDHLGIKKSLTARSEVIPCNTYHLKLAIADRGDAIYDSGVFISELKGGAPNLTVQYNSGIDYLVENCTNQPDEVIIELTSAFDDTVSYHVVVGGTATPGMDYLLDIPPVITFLPGQTQLAFPITPLSDLLTENTETITIALTNNFGCGDVTYTELTIELQDEINVQIFSGQDTIFVCQDSSIVLEVSGAASYFWTPVNVFADPTSATPTASPSSSQWVFVEGNVGPCVDHDSIYLQIIAPSIMVEALDPTAICQGDSVRLVANNNVNNQNLNWMPATGLDDPLSQAPVANPQVTTTYTASVNVAGCIVTDTITIDVAPFDFPAVANDTLICQNYSVQLASLIDPANTTTVFQWTPETGLNGPSLSGPIATPDVTTTYQLIATSANGACADTAEVTITVFPADVTIANPDTTEICLGETVELTAVTSTGSADNLLWWPNDGTLSDTTGLTVTASPVVSNWYYTTFSVGACAVFDSVYVRVDSLPDLAITADPEKDFYCQGDIVTLSSTTYEPVYYPDITHQWIQGLSFQTPDTLWNMVFTAEDTTIYRRITINHACRDSADILIIVKVPPALSLIPQDTTICIGESVQLQLNINGQYQEIEWQGDGLSCTDCLNPVATPGVPGIASYTATIDPDECPTSISARIEVYGPPTYALNTVRSVCEGGSLQLNLASDAVTDYTWTSTDPSFGQSSEPMPVITPDATYTYYLFADNGVCPPAEDSLSVAVIPQADVSINTSTPVICAGDVATITAEVTNSSADDSFVWTNSANSDVLTGMQIQVAPSQTATYFLEFTSGGGCDTLNREITIEVVPKPVYNLIDDAVICFGDSIQLNLASDDISLYTWAATDPNFGTVTEPRPTVTPTQTTTYTLNVDNGVCPPETFDILVEVVNPMNLQIEGPAGLICAGDAVTLSASVTGGSSQDIFYWEGSDGTNATGSSVSFNPTETTVYNLTYTDGGNCTTLTGSFTVEVEPGISVELQSDIDLTMDNYQGTPASFEAIVATGASGALVYTWLLNGEVLAEQPGLNTYEDLLIANPSVYSVIVTTPTGCADTATVSIPVLEPKIGVPNAFTPNGDDTNETFSYVISGKVLRIAEFKVYNRWGQLVFEKDTENPDDFQGWDGSFNDKPQPSDTYFYIISLERYDGKTEKLTGDVTLLR
ncbi:MAG: choice-of-anchor L domain-containing protein [Lewinellaceae bacterium]|nr:choice-of-anchor L domain-containing protein [Lewinellaceae bacterium]